MKRFWDKVDVRGKDDCWPWKAGVSKSGYGAFWYCGKTIGAHCFAYGNPAIVVRHTCHVPLCCNPAHLRAGTQQDNVADRVTAGRSARGRMPANTILDKAKADAIRTALGTTTQRRIAAAFGVSEQTVCDIKHGRRWV